MSGMLLRPRDELPIKWCTNHVMDYFRVCVWGEEYHKKKKKKVCWDLKEENKNIISLY